MKKLFITTVLALGVIVVPAGSASALVIAPDDRPTPVPVDEQPYDIRCKIIEHNLQAKIETFEKRRANHIAHYEEIQTKIENIVKRLDNAGYNTEPIRELLPGLQTRIDAFADNSQQFLTDLRQAKRAVCVSRELYQNELQEARESLRETREAAKAVKSYVQDELVPTVRKVIANPPTDEPVISSQS